MKRKPLCLLIAALVAPAPAVAGNCGVGVGAGVGNPNCSGGPRTPQTNHAGVQPVTNTQPPAQLGTIVPDHHNTALAPVVVTGTVATVTGYGPVPQGTQQPAITGTSPVPQRVTGTQSTITGYGPVPQGTQQPAVTGTSPVPQTVTGTQPTITGYGPVPQGTQQPAITGTGPVPQQVTGTQTTITGYGPIPLGTQATITGYGSGSKPGPKLIVKPGLTVDPTLTRPIVVTGTQTTITGYGPVPQGTQRPAVTGTGPVPLQVTGTQTVAAAGSATLVPSSAHRNALLVHAPNTPQPVTSGAHPVDGIYSFEFIEPGLQHRKVKVYRTQDAAEEVYKDTIPLDQGGFQVIVIGTRNPAYVH